LAHVSRNVHAVQDALGRPLVVENVSSYLSYEDSRLSEWEFLRALVERTGCKLLFDLNNVLVSAKNHGYDPHDYLEGVPKSAVWQLHLANHDDRGHYKFDSHRGPVPSELWELYEASLARFGAVSTLIEWDTDVPEWAVLVAEQREAKRRCDAFLALERPRNVEEEPRQDPGAKLRIAAPPKLDLEGTQRLLWDVIVWPTGADSFVEKLDEQERRTLNACFTHQGALSRVERLQIYAESYFYRLLEVLAELFELTRALIGPGRFHNLVTDYLLARPSTNPDVRRVGEGFEAFIAGHDVSRSVPHLAADSTVSGPSSSSARMNERWTAFRSSRTLPSQRPLSSRRSAWDDQRLRVPFCSLSSFRKCSARSSMSSGRSRSGGSASGKTARR
jgi:hypothetical protein